jgi:hypothetical protein
MIEIEEDTIKWKDIPCHELEEPIMLKFSVVCGVTCLQSSLFRRQRQEDFEFKRSPWKNSKAIFQNRMKMKWLGS